MVYQTSTNMYGETRYIVDNVGPGMPYTTIQSAINAAQAAGIDATIVIRPGTYVENLVLIDGIDFCGSTGSELTSTVTITGMHTPPLAGSVSFRQVKFTSATNIFNSAAAGTANISLESCVTNCTNGYTFNLPNWVGTIYCDDTATMSGNDGFCNLTTAAATIIAVNSNLGNGTNPMIVEGAGVFYDCNIPIPAFFRDDANILMKNCYIQNLQTFTNLAQAVIYNTVFDTGVNAAIHTLSANGVALSDVTIDSSCATVITGTGRIQFGSVSYLDSDTVAGTITKDFTTRLETGEIKVDDATVGVVVSTAGVFSAIVPLTPAYGGSGLTSLTDHSVLVGSGAGAITPIAVGATGELLTGVTGADPAFSNISYGTFNFLNNLVATPIYVNISNADNNAASNASQIINATAGGGDAFTLWQVAGTTFYAMGIDNSDAGDPLKISSGVTPSAATTLFTMTNVGLITLAIDLDVSEGGTGVSTLTSHGILMGNGAGDIQATAEPLNGQVLIGKTGDFPQLAGLTPGPGIAITNGAGTITVSAWGGGVSWTVETVNLNYTVNKGIIANKAGLLTVTLPATAAVGDILEITGINTAVGWRIAQNAAQRIHYGALSSTAGVGGYIEATAIRDSAKLLCVVAGASTEYNVISSIGNLTVI